MKVLWFTNTPCNAINKIGSKIVGGGWLTALENEIKTNSNIELYVCFYSNKNIRPFYYENVNYYPIPLKHTDSKLSALFYRYYHYFKPRKEESLSSLLQVIEEVKPNIIHIHGSEENFGLLQYKIKHIPIVLSIQGLLNPYLEKFFSGIPYNILTKFEPLRSKLLLDTNKILYKRFKYWAEREQNILACSKHVIGRTEWDRHITMLLAPQAKYYKGNEILRKEFYQHTWSKQNFSNPLIIVSTISNGPYKGLEVVLKTAKYLNDYGLKFKWIVVGQDESSTYAKTITKWLQLSYQRNHISLVGKKDTSELIHTLLQADIYCQVSHIENSPNSLCEAMLLGIPIIASCVGGTNSLIKHKEEGYLIQDGDPYSLAGTLIDVSQNYSIAKEWGKQARITAIKRHNPQQVGNEYIQIYKSLTICN